MAPSHGILVLGSGELGSQVLQSLVKNGTFINTGISVLQRSSDLPSQLSQAARECINIVQCDLNSASVNDLSVLFEPYEAIVCCTGFVGGPGTQIKITKAVLKSNGPRKLYIPWQFGIDYDKIGRGSGQIVWDEQLDVRNLLRSQDKADWIIISTGMFTSFLFESSFGVIDRDARTCRCLGSWENKVTVTCVEDIGKCTAAILSQQENLQNRVVFIGGDTISYGQLADIASKRWEGKGETEREEWSLEHLRKELDKDPGDTIKMYRYAFAKGIGMSWPLENCWNSQNDLRLMDVESWCQAHRMPQVM